MGQRPFVLSSQTEIVVMQIQLLRKTVCQFLVSLLPTFLRYSPQPTQSPPFSNTLGSFHCSGLWEVEDILARGRRASWLHPAEFYIFNAGSGYCPWVWDELTVGDVMATERKSVDGGESGLFQAILIVRSIAEGEGIFLYTFLAVFRGKSNLQLLFLCLVQ